VRRHLIAASAGSGCQLVTIKTDSIPPLQLTASLSA